MILCLRQTPTTVSPPRPPAGTYPITFATEALTATNYSFNYVSGTLLVSVVAGGIPAVAADAFTSTLGVETHLQYNAANGYGTESPYNNVTQVTSEIGYLNPNGPGTGVAIFRDSQVPNTPLLAQVAGQTGSKIDLYYSTNPAPPNAPWATWGIGGALDGDGYLASIEGALEVDNPSWGLAENGDSFSGQTSGSGWEGVVASQIDIYNYFTNATNAPNKVPVILWSLAVPTDGEANSPAVAAASAQGTTVPAIANWGNLHFYAHNGQNPHVEEQGFLQQETGYTPNMPFATTETGFNDGNIAGSNYAGNETANAAYTLDNILNLFRDGSKQTDIYELNNDMTNGGSFEDYWGLFNNDGTPKLSATYLHNFLAVVSDGKTNPNETTMASLNYTVTGMTDAKDVMLTAKRDGTLDLTLWDDQNLSDASGNLIQPVPASVHVDLGMVFAQVQIFDPSQGATAIQTLTNVSGVDLSLDGSPLIIQVSPQLGN